MTPFAYLRSLTTRTFGRFAADESGATAIEYSIMAAMIGLVIISAVRTLGQTVSTTLYGSIVNALSPHSG